MTVADTELIPPLRSQQSFMLGHQPSKDSHMRLRSTWRQLSRDRLPPNSSPVPNPPQLRPIASSSQTILTSASPPTLLSKNKEIIEDDTAVLAFESDLSDDDADDT
jgi:hypothetical protein